MAIDALDPLRWGLYAITAALGVALIVWVVRDRALRRRNMTGTGTERPSLRTIAAPSLVMDPAVLAEALAGIHLPIHWVPDPAPEIVPPVVLTTERDSPETVARMLSDELARLGYHLHPIGDNAARAVKDASQLRIEVGSTGPAVVARITMSRGADGG